MKQKYIVRWTMEFTTRHMKGVFIDNELDFSTNDEARDFVSHLNSGPIETYEGNTYIAHQARVVIEGGFNAYL